MPTNYNSLPPEAVACIFEKLTTVECLWSLACSSSLGWTAFHLYGPRILDSVLQYDTHPWINKAIRLDFNIRAGKAQPMRYVDLRRIESDYRDNTRMTTQVEPEFARRFVTKVRKTHAMAHVILANCMKNLWGLEGKLPRDEDEDLSEAIDRNHNVEDEVRMVLGLWLCELHMALYIAARDDSLPWVKAMFTSMPKRNIPLINFFRRTWRGTFLTIWHGFTILHVPGDEKARPMNRLVQPPPFMETPRLPSGSLDMTRWCPTDDFFDFRYVAGTEDGWKCYHIISQALRRTPLAMFFLTGMRAVGPRTDELFKLPEIEYIRFGLLHWDHDKLSELKLLPEPGNPYTRYELFDYWKSLLTQDTIEVHRDNQAQYKANYWARVDAIRGVGADQEDPDDFNLYDTVREEWETEYEDEDGEEEEEGREHEMDGDADEEFEQDEEESIEDRDQYEE